VKAKSRLWFSHTATNRQSGREPRDEALRRTHGRRWYDQGFGCVFNETESAVFDSEILAALLFRRRAAVAG
jgi:hypothetical protein